ncbi:lipase family protein [Allokutzneria albata]|uniref:Lipase (Class 3) n=1 Tax=Allokutzneria albata TaxID=211114 RepID=A0A1G9T8L0_ALLAB|nr:lipase family protein [Allokutzneria albata]SDM43996.1 Lipase (class 3) [Allokutzneria albata]
MTTAAASDHKATGHSLAHAHWLAKAAGLAYSDPATVTAKVGEWGFDRVRHHHTRHTPPFPLQDTQAYTAASDSMIVVAFRGTQPVEIRDWLSDITTPPWPGYGGTGFIHFGFGQALDSVYADVLDAITTLRDNDQTLWITGHSLGGALAMLAGARLYFEDPKLLAGGIYTYGQPRTCDPLLAAAHNKAFAKRMHRFVNNNDIVAQVPPEPLLHHVNALHYIDASGRIRDSMPLLGALVDRVKGLTADALAPARDAIRDHSITKYVDAIGKNL